MTASLDYLEIFILCLLLLGIGFFCFRLQQIFHLSRELREQLFAMASPSEKPGRRPIHRSTNQNPQTPTLAPGNPGPPLCEATIDCISSELRRRDITYVLLYHDRHSGETYHYLSSDFDARSLVNEFQERMYDYDD